MNSDEITSIGIVIILITLAIGVLLNTHASDNYKFQLIDKCKGNIECVMAVKCAYSWECIGAKVNKGTERVEND